MRLQYTGPDGHPSSGAVIVASIFGAGIGLMIGAVLMVLSAHRRELHYHYHPEERPAPTSSGSSVKERREEDKTGYRQSSLVSHTPRFRLMRVGVGSGAGGRQSHSAVC